MNMGYWAIGIFNGKKETNMGTLWRSAHIFGASFIFTINRRYKFQSSDTIKAWHSIPLYNYSDLEDLKMHLPIDCQLIGIELTDKATRLDIFIHPKRAIYLLGAEDHGLNDKEISQCHKIIYIPGGKYCLNVATAGSIVMYDRICKTGAKPC